jgi:hypothetical protein
MPRLKANVAVVKAEGEASKVAEVARPLAVREVGAPSEAEDKAVVEEDSPPTAVPETSLELVVAVEEQVQHKTRTSGCILSLISARRICCRDVSSYSRRSDAKRTPIHCQTRTSVMPLRRVLFTCSLRSHSPV